MKRTALSKKLSKKLGGTVDARTSKLPKVMRRFTWTGARRAVQIVALIAFVSTILLAGWSLFGLTIGGDEALPVPSGLPFFGSLSSSSIGEVTLLDPFATLQVAAASKTFESSWLLFALPIVVIYGLVRARTFCGWVCPVNLLLEGVDFLRRKLPLTVHETPIPRHTKLWIALATIVLSGILSIPLFEAFSPISAVNKGILFGSTAGIFVLVAIVITELFWGHRVWCRSLCPLGGFYQAIGRLGIVNVKYDSTACTQCKACQEACLADPSILAPVLTEHENIVRAGDCMACGSCVDACPTRALSLGLGKR